MSKDKFDKKFYLVREDVLPEAMKKTLEAKEMIERKKSNPFGMLFNKLI